MFDQVVNLLLATSIVIYGMFHDSYMVLTLGILVEPFKKG